MTYFDIFRASDLVAAQGEDGPVVLPPGGGRGAADDVAVDVSLADGRLAVDVTAERTPLTRVRLRWRGSMIRPCHPSESR